jgi:hypothetical protein
MNLLQVDLHGGDGGLNVGGKEYIAKPLLDNFPVFYNFAMIVLFIIALFAAHRIYSKWQLGEDNVMPHVAKWFGGIIVVFFLITFLKVFIASQDFSGVNTPNIPNSPTLTP